MMITYQVKIKIDATIEKDWIDWMKIEHVPLVIATGLVRSFQIMKSESETATYIFHYNFESKQDFEIYEKDFAPNLKKHVLDYYAGKFTAERDLLLWI